MSVQPQVGECVSINWKETIMPEFGIMVSFWGRVESADVLTLFKLTHQNVFSKSFILEKDFLSFFSVSFLMISKKI